MVGSVCPGNFLILQKKWKDDTKQLFGIKPKQQHEQHKWNKITRADVWEDNLSYIISCLKKKEKGLIVAAITEMKYYS